MAGVDDVVDVGVDGVAAGRPLQGRRLQQPSPSHAPDVILIKHLLLESRVDDCGDAQLFRRGTFSVRPIYTVAI